MASQFFGFDRILTLGIERSRVHGDPGDQAIDNMKPLQLLSAMATKSLDETAIDSSMAVK
jgi:hypothetical protein